MGEGKEILRGEEKKQNKGNHSPPPRGGLIPSLPPNSHLRSQKYTSLHRNQTKTFFFLYLSSTLHGTEHFFGKSGSAALAASPHNLLPTPCLLAAVAEWGKESPDAGQGLRSNSQNTRVLSALSSHQSKTQHHSGCYEES